MADRTHGSAATTTAELADAEQAMAAAAARAGILEGFGLDPTQAEAAVSEASEQMRAALDRLAAGQ